jgi:TM2 domain-containing membrane protein YozV
MVRQQSTLLDGRIIICQMVRITIDKEFLLIILAIIIPGSSHIYLNRFRRGIIILALVVGLSVIDIPSIPFGVYVSIAIWIWQIYDIRKIMKEKNRQIVDKYDSSVALEIGINESKCQSCGFVNNEKSNFCSRCGSKV